MWKAAVWWSQAGLLKGAEPLVKVLSSFTSSALLQCTLTIVRLGMISLFVLFISWLAVVDRWQCGAFGLLGTPSSWSFFFFLSPPSSSLVSCMKLASCPGQGLCLSHARLDLRHFIALTLPPTVTAALNEATHMCSLQVGQEPDIQLNAGGWTSLTLAHRCFRAPVSASLGFYPPEKWGPSQCIKRGQ